MKNAIQWGLLGICLATLAHADDMPEGLESFVLSTLSEIQGRCLTVTVDPSYLDFRTRDVRQTIFDKRPTGTKEVIVPKERFLMTFTCEEKTLSFGWSIHTKQTETTDLTYHATATMNDRLDVESLRSDQTLESYLYQDARADWWKTWILTKASDDSNWQTR